MKLPNSSYNWISIIGGVISLISFFMIIFLFTVSYFLHQGSSYVGVFIYMVLPGFLIFGLILIPVGMVLKIRSDKRRKIRDPQFRWPQINLNDTRHRNAFVIFSISTTIFLFLSAVGTYEGFHYTESVEFCGTLCHEVMKPEYVAYQHSPHARVTCVECHVGEGVDWYVRSKLSGLYQVYSVLFDKYERPIPTPIQNLRPARETCERCHWPQKFYSRKLRTQKNFLADEKNTEWDITMQMKIGPSLSALGLQEGIHWHINPDVKIEYITESEKKESIPWVKYTNLKTDESHIYKDEDNLIADSVLVNLETRKMDCMDCHNRPSHSYKSPPFFIDIALIAGTIPKELPNIKKVAMELLKDPFENTDSALLKIEKGVWEFYQTNMPNIYNNKKDLIQKAIAGIQTEFQNNMFPEMKVRYDAYPDHIGHMESNGCFRCHSDKHKSEDGHVITKDCNLCHTIIAQGKADSLMVTSITDTLEFEHPVDVQGAEREYFCTECHTYLYP